VAGRLFVYGTLLFPRVVRALLGRPLEARPARLPGYARYVVEGQDYPGIVPSADAGIEGAVLLGVDAGMFRRLDAFEGAMYERRVVEVVTAGGETLAASTYVVRDEHRRHLSTRPWDAARFERTGLRRFLDHYPGFGAGGRARP
jgi:gamma-glutamylcyclotransferase (GGCT)/AIG2-like uncharacterized protein YtfP